MDIYSRKLIGFEVIEGSLTGPIICQMFNRILINTGQTPKYLSSDHDPLFRFSQWQRNLSISEIDEIKSIPEIPLSHPFIERVIGTTRREYLDHQIIWGPNDLCKQLQEFQNYYNENRVHYSLNGQTPLDFIQTNKKSPLDLNNYSWEVTCNGRYQIPIAA